MEALRRKKIDEGVNDDMVELFSLRGSSELLSNSEVHEDQNQEDC